MAPPAFSQALTLSPLHVHRLLSPPPPPPRPLHSQRVDGAGPDFSAVDTREPKVTGLLDAYYLGAMRCVPCPGCTHERWMESVLYSRLLRRLAEECPTQTCPVYAVAVDSRQLRNLVVGGLESSPAPDLPRPFAAPGLCAREEVLRWAHP